MAGKGSKAKPIPTGLKFGYTVEDSDSTKRATVIEQYAIGAEGLVTNPTKFPKCSFTQLDDATVPTSCQKAQVGAGLVKNAAGPARRAPVVSARCQTARPATCGCGSTTTVMA